MGTVANLKNYKGSISCPSLIDEGGMQCDTLVSVATAYRELKEMNLQLYEVNMKLFSIMDTFFAGAHCPMCNPCPQYKKVIDAITPEDSPCMRNL